jgi:hypothetical protein
LGRILEARQDLVDGNTWEVRRQKFRLLLDVAVCPMVVVGSLNLSLLMREHEACDNQGPLALTGSLLQFSIKPS